ncbi:hypothetical protein RJ639_043205 [Escallonia herrerae]|uniref:FPL domain-containing protein n=1 Tax=Escallonia herrerae TaxID=1293975 RepID=A0AA88WFT3_9ASTE|nr:hypothetical protein RJ639_043205 [Escallonia herrerae]
MWRTLWRSIDRFSLQHFKCFMEYQDAVISFPLYSEALKFAYHGEKMIQIAVRTLTLDIYNVSDDMVYQYLTTLPASNYFSDLLLTLRKKCFHLDSLVHSTEETCNYEQRKECLLESDKIVDDLYYFKDILRVGKPRLRKMVTENRQLIDYPSVAPTTAVKSEYSEIFFHLKLLIFLLGTYMSAITSFYVVSRLLQIVEEKDVVDFVASAILCKDAAELGTVYGSSLLANHLHGVKEMAFPQPQGAENSEEVGLLGRLSEYISSSSPFTCLSPGDKHIERNGLLSYISSDNPGLMLVALMLLLLLAESGDLDYRLAAILGSSETKARMLKTHDSTSQIVDRSFLGLHMPSTSYEQSSKCVLKELDGCWFDYIPDTLRDEWARCKIALEEPLQSKDPFVAIELACDQHTPSGSTVSACAWQRMVDVVKVLVLHLQLKAFLFNEELSKNPLINLKSGCLASGLANASDLSSATFGSEVGSGIPCKIAFSKYGTRDLYVIPVARGTSGKLLLVEKHPLRSKRGVVIAIAPLAGLTTFILLAFEFVVVSGKDAVASLKLLRLCHLYFLCWTCAQLKLVMHSFITLKQPKVDQNHPTWLCLRIREFHPKLDRGRSAHSPNQDADGRWTLGFSNAESCKAAQLLILEEIDKQRSSVKSLLAPLVHDIPPEDLADTSTG